MYLAGARWEAIYPASAIFHGIGVNVTAASCLDQMNWGAVGDPVQVADVWPLLDAIRDVQAELLSLVPKAVARAPIANTKPTSSSNGANRPPRA